MESFIKWGKEKRKLDLVIEEAKLDEIGLLAAGAGLAAAAGVGVYLWQRGRAKVEKKDDFWVRRKSTGESKVFGGREIVQMVRTGELKWTDEVSARGQVGAQNWKSIKDAKRFLPFEQVSKGKVRDNTVWWAYINRQKKKYNNSTKFAQAIVDREIEPDTLIWRAGYDGWLPYKHKDVQDDIHAYVSKISISQGPSVGDKELRGRKTYYFSKDDERRGPIKFEDLVKAELNGEIDDDSWVWIQGYGNKKWVKFKEVKRKLPSTGQAPKVSPRGRLGKFGKWLGDKWHGRDHDDKYVQQANAVESDFNADIDDPKGFIEGEALFQSIHTEVMKRLPEDMKQEINVKMSNDLAHLLSANLINKWLGFTDTTKGVVPSPEASDTLEEFMKFFERHGQELLDRFRQEVLGNIPNKVD